jgi:hypothetical protein
MRLLNKLDMAAVLDIGVWRRNKADSIRSIYRLSGIGVPLRRLRQTSGDRIQKRFGKHAEGGVRGRCTAVVSG